ncbi:hypothetical protein FE257_009599 [Aspergillus nanangensis]|uniref:SGNH hydrolase-type esterase domain-containing protein n=1 Tax=Aspergillus nanangensis TaxID=2582783 RepID=A0AAD4CL78_ASPNN|nr:hypothetical protein FE257_009599 [Aspergillus nanangensis]
MALHAVSRRWNSWTAWLTLILLLVSIANAATLPTRTLRRRDELADGVLLKVLPIGDSITKGSQSSDDNGYREKLHIKLEAYTNAIDFVGGESIGSMEDSQHEGHGGYTINQIEQASAIGVYAEANIVLLHAGTNNMKNDADAARAPDDLRSLIDYIYENSEDAVIFLAQIIPSSTLSYQPRIATYNEKVAEIYDEYKDDKKMVLVDMHTALGDGHLADNLHPNDSGYAIMAQQWMDAIVEADSKDMISAPGKGETPPTGTTPENCRQTPSWYGKGQIAAGAKVATSDGLFEPGWGSKVVVKAGECKRSWVRFLDLDGDGLKDYACLDPDSGAMKVWRNIPGDDYKSTGTWEELGEVATGDVDRDGKRVMFADLNGDGRDDYIFLNPRTGNVEAWINELTNADNVWQWNYIGVISEGVAVTPETLRMGDIDGDGRDDFLVINEETGAVTGWLNTGAEDMPDYYKLGEIATGATATENDKILFGDLTGNGRADYIVVGETGKAVGLVNRMQGLTLLPRWLAAVTLREGPDGAEQEGVHFADITGNGQADYLLVGEQGSVAQWENVGTGGKYQEGEGVFLCDLNGDGVSDYFWIDPTGKGWGYINKGKGEDKWQELGNIARGNHKREEVRMAVLTQSKRADYVVVNGRTGKAEWYENLGPDSDGNYQFAARGVIADGPKDTIEKTFKMRWNAKNVRFADLDNDGLDDYLYVDDQGATVMWRFRGANESPILAAPKLVADGVGVLAQDVHFADTDGDTRLDYVVVGRITGAARTWRNLGVRGSEATDGEPGSIRWDTPTSFADGVAGDTPGSKMTGDNRWDYVVVGPDQGSVLLWQNRCFGYPYDPEPGDPKCKWDDEDPKAWDGSGAAKLVDDFIVKWTAEDWLVEMDKTYNKDAPGDPVGLTCGLLSGNCPVLEESCSSMEYPEFWWVRTLANHVNVIFNEVHTALTSETIVNLGSVGSMIRDFDTEEPEPSLLSKIFENLGAIAGIAGSIATVGGAENAANIFGLIGSAISLTSLTMSDEEEVDDTSKIRDATEQYIVDVFKDSADRLQEALSSMFGDDAQPLKDLYQQLVDSNLVPESDRKSIQGKVFDGGQWLDLSADGIRGALEKSVEATLGTILGHLLASLKYIVVNAKINDRDACDFFPESARMIDDECLYLVRRPRGKEDSESVPEDIIQKIEDKYNIRMEDILKNAKECDNGKATDIDTIYTGSLSYPPCFFGIGYVKATNIKYPFDSPSNDDKLPEWVQENVEESSGGDSWNDGLEKACTLESWKKKDECITL